MKFEDALAQMRLGKKITHKFLAEEGEENVYFMACRVSLMGEYMGESIVKMKGEYQHEDMMAGDPDHMCYPGTMRIREEFLEKPCKHGRFPQLNLLLLMHDDWEVIE
jgi:hypothetical protein